MPVELKWYIPNHVIYTRFYGEVVMEVLKDNFDIIHDMHESVDTPLVHTIADLSDISSFPKNLSDYQHVFAEKAANSGWVILIGDNKLIRFFSAITTKVMNLRLTYVNNLDEAMQFLIARDAAITADKVKEAQS